MHFRPLTRSRGGWAPAPRAGGAGSAGGALFPRGGETGYMTPTTLSRIGGPNESCRLRRRIHRPVPRAGEAEPARPARRHRRDRSERRLPLGPVDHARLRPRPAGHGARPRGRRTRQRDGPRGIACEEGRPGHRVLRARVRRVLALSPRADRTVRARARGLDADARDPAGRQPVLLHDRPRHVRRGDDGRRGVGQAVIQGARIAGAGRIIAIDPQELKRKTAKQLGATDTIDPSKGDPVEQVKALTGGRGADYAFEVIGLPETILTAYNLARRGGEVIIVGMARFEAQFSLPAFGIFFEEKTVRGCKYGSAQVRRDFPRFVDLIETRRLDISAMVSKTIKLEGVNDAFRAMEAGEVIRSVIA